MQKLLLVHTTPLFSSAAAPAVAARDPEGGQPLYWGATDEGQLLLGSHLNDLDGCDPTATMFPQGTAYIQTVSVHSFLRVDTDSVAGENAAAWQSI